MFPIVLAHGIARFDILRQLVHDELNLPPNEIEDKLQYFRKVRTFLEENGFSQVSNANVNFAGSLKMRAAGLKSDVEGVLAETGAERVHIIAHSMGGLDARMMIVDSGMADRVASLTTIGTPHLGTVLANRVLGFGGRLLIKAVQDAIRLDLNGFKDLTTTACNAFNRRARDAEAKNNVFYQVYSSYDEGAQMFLPLIGSWTLIRAFEGINDGLVSVRSQMWESELIASDGTPKQIIQREFPFRADHLNQTGWWNLSETLDGQIGGNPVQEKLHYEQQVRDVYLEIALNLQNLPNQ